MPRDNQKVQEIGEGNMIWGRTGKITMRSGEYLIIKYPGPRYMALHGPQTARVTLGAGLPSAEAAKVICEQHQKIDAVLG